MQIKPIDRLKASDVTIVLSASIRLAYPNPDYKFKAEHAGMSLEEMRDKFEDDEEQPFLIWVESTTMPKQLVTPQKRSHKYLLGKPNRFPSIGELEENEGPREKFDGNCIVQFITTPKPVGVRNGVAYSMYRLHFYPAELMHQWAFWVNRAGGYEWIQHVTRHKMAVRPGVTRTAPILLTDEWVQRGVMDVDVEWIPGYEYSVAYAPDDPRAVFPLVLKNDDDVVDDPQPLSPDELIDVKVSTP